MYKVETYHHKKEWRNGDLEDGFELIESKLFKTRTSAKDYIESKLRYKNPVTRNYHKGDQTSYCVWFTGNTWIHENTGEKMEEYYQYTLKKAKVNQ